jgi:stress response protein SCP2
MTFIIAVQLKDSIVVAVDNKHLLLKDKKLNQYQEYSSSKLYAWHSGIITGTGEHYVIDKAIRLFINNVDSDLEKLPTCLNISKQIREMEVGYHEQIQTSKLLYSSYSENGAKLFSVESTEELGKYQTTEFKENDLIIWLFNPNIHSISEDLKSLYANPRPHASFNRVEDWIDYYISAIAEIYAKHSDIDSWMSRSFDIFFQTKTHYFYKHIENNKSYTIL